MNFFSFSLFQDSSVFLRMLFTYVLLFDNARLYVEILLCNASNIFFPVDQQDF